jgi:transmembrane sensor
MQADMEYIENLIIASLTGNISPEEQGFLDEMIEADEDVRKRWLELQKVHSQLYAGYDKESAWNNVLLGITTADKVKRKRRYLLIAPVIVLLLVAGGIFFFNYDKGSVDKVLSASAVKVTKGIVFSTDQGMVIFEKNQQGSFMAGDVQVTNTGGTLEYKADGAIAKTGTIEVPQGLDYQLTLSDSTKVWINAATKLEFPLAFTGNTREVKLTGEAYFEVAHNDKKPFIVHSGQMNVKVLGTSFNIKAYENEPVQTSLVTGRVEASINNKQTSVVLSPGKAVRIKDQQLQELSFDTNYTLAWIKGYYYFNSESLAQINYTVERWFGLSFTYEDATIGNIDFSGALEKKQNLTDFLNRVSTAANLSYRIDGGKILLSKK